ncbi:MAG: hypothetical protein AB7U85_02035 [Alphaproteobacteria bacterium]
MNNLRTNDVLSKRLKKTTDKIEQDKDLIIKAVGKNEDESGKKTYQISHAGTSKSSFSVGRLQTDFAGDDKEITRDDFIKNINNINRNLFNDGKITNDGLLTSDDINQIKEGLVIKGNVNAISKSVKNKINTALQSKEGQEIVNKLDKQQVNNLLVGVKKTRDAALSNPDIANNPASAAYVNSDAFMLRIADNINQYGSNGRMCDWLKGDKTYIDKKTNKEKPFGNPISKDVTISGDVLKKYTDNYKYAKEHTKNYNKRIDNLDTVLKEQKDNPAKKQNNEADFKQPSVFSGSKDIAKNIDSNLSNPIDFDKIKTKQDAIAETLGTDAANAGQNNNTDNTRQGDETVASNSFLSKDTAAGNFKNGKNNANDILEKLSKNVDISSIILAKRPEEMTKEEMREAQNFVFDKVFHPKRLEVDDHIKKYFGVRYPGKTEYDDTGRMIDTPSVINEPLEPSQIKDKQGKPVEHGLKGIAGLIDNADGITGGKGVEVLQKALNYLGRSFGVNDYDVPDKIYLREPVKTLKEDNILGPKTATATFDNLVKNGANNLTNAFNSILKKQKDDLY